jgi:hypothetical protein
VLGAMVGVVLLGSIAFVPIAVLLARVLVVRVQADEDWLRACRRQCGNPRSGQPG